MSGEVTVYESQQPPALNWSQEELGIIKDTLAPDLKASQFAFYIAAAKHLGLDPLRKEIHAVVIKSRLVCQIGIDGYTKWAAQTGKFLGFTEPIVTIEDKEGEIHDVMPRHYNPDKHTLISVTLGVRHVDDDGDPELFTCHFKEYVALKDGRPNERWTKAPLSQLVKCCQALAIRRRFPGMGADVYTDTEVEQMQYSLTQDSSPKKPRSKQRATLTVEDAVHKGGSNALALGMADDKATKARFMELFLMNWSRLMTPDEEPYTSMSEIPPDHAEAILEYLLKNNEWIDELRQESLIPLKR
jgi:phage recombination protein Bet